MNNSISGPTASRTACARGILANDSNQWPGVAVAQRLIADRHLQTPEALRNPKLRGGNKLLAVEEAETERGIDRHARPRSPEQAPDRLAKHFSFDVPQRH